MSLTHYWQRPTELPREPFRSAVLDVRKLLDSSLVELAGFDGTGEPIIRDDHIVFNGREPRTCEPFELAALQFDRRGRSVIWSNCKTHGMPYDLLVKAVLIVFKHHFHDCFTVASDDQDDGWAAARTWVTETLQYGDSFSLNVE